MVLTTRQLKRAESAWEAAEMVEDGALLVCVFLSGTNTLLSLLGGLDDAPRLVRAAAALCVLPDDTWRAYLSSAASFGEAEQTEQVKGSLESEAIRQVLNALRVLPRFAIPSPLAAATDLWAAVGYPGADKAR